MANIAFYMLLASGTSEKINLYIEVLMVLLKYCGNSSNAMVKISKVLARIMSTFETPIEELPIIMNSLFKKNLVNIKDYQDCLIMVLAKPPIEKNQLLVT